MLHQHVDSSAIAATLLANARAALDHDLGTARECLKQLAGLPGFQPHMVGSEPARGGLAAWQVRRITEFVDANLEATIAIGDLAAVARLSHGHLCRAFKASMGETPHAYVMRRRVHHAKLLMLTTAAGLSHIASVCGFTDQAHLTRLFRRHLDQTPSTWRRTWREAA